MHSKGTPTTDEDWKNLTFATLKAFRLGEMGQHLNTPPPPTTPGSNTGNTHCKSMPLQDFEKSIHHDPKEFCELKEWSQWDNWLLHMQTKAGAQ